MVLEWANLGLSKSGGGDSLVTKFYNNEQSLVKVANAVSFPPKTDTYEPEWVEIIMVG